MNSFEWEDSTIIERPYVEIDGVKHYVQGGTYSGGTPVTSNNLNEMESIINTNISTETKGKILWVNPNPTNTMGEGTNITLSSDDYDMLIWIFCYNNTATNVTIQSGIACLKGNSCLMSLVGYSTGTTVRRRLDYVNDTTYSAKNGMTSAGGSGASYCIPLYAIGYKTRTVE